MSKRASTQQALRALTRKQGQGSPVRYFVTASAYQTTKTSQGSTSGKGKRKEAKKKDDKLRHAINLYHLTDFFFPTTTESTSTSALFGSGSEKKEQQTTETLDDKLDHHIRTSIMGSSVMSSAISNFDSTMTMVPIHAALHRKLKDDDKEFSSVFQSTSSSSSSISDTALASKVFPLRQFPFAASKNTTTSSDQTLLPPLPPVEDRAAVEKYISDTAKRAATKASKDRPGPGLNNLDIRGAQVMDALYGTVSGQLPGLEVLKERAKEREQSKVPRQQSTQAKDA